MANIGESARQEAEAARERRNTLLNWLRQQLQFLRLGGYTRAYSTPWRPTWLLLDSPYCRRGSVGAAAAQENYGDEACRGCPLLGLAREYPNQSGMTYPCYGIAMGSAGETLGDLVRQGLTERAEVTLGYWLEERIEEICRGADCVEPSAPRKTVEPGRPAHHPRAA